MNTSGGPVGSEKTGEEMNDTADAAPGSRRVLSIDIMRGFALIGMVLVHFMIYFGNNPAIDTWPYFIFNHVLGDWGAACFLMMMGMSQVISSAKLEDADNLLLFKRALIRGTYLFVIGLIMLGLAWGPYQMWQWDILTLMGFATVVLFFCRFLPSWAILASGAGLVAITPPVRNLFDFTASWGGKFIEVPVISKYIPGILLDPTTEYEVAWSVKRIGTGFLTNGYFPVLPWLVFPLIGFVIGRRIVAGKIRRDLPLLAVIGAAGTVTGLAIAYGARTRSPSAVINAFYSQLSFSPDSFSMVFFQTGMALLAFTGLYYCYDVLKKDPDKRTPLQSMYQRTSGFSLTFYFLHYQLIGWPLFLVWLFTGDYKRAALMGDVPALLCGLAAVALLEVLLYYWLKAKGKYSLEWFLGALTLKLTGPVAKKTAAAADS